MTRRPLAAFFAITFAITWGLAAAFALFPRALEAWSGPLSPKNPLFVLAVWAPSISALAVTTATAGWPGVKALLARVVRGHAGAGPWAFVLLGVPALGVLAAILGGVTPSPALAKPWVIAPILARRLFLDPGPLGEEPGWRGFALPRLLAGRSALGASLILGAIWAVWHLPAFALGGTPQAGHSLPAFVASALALSVLATWLAQASGGGVLLCVLLHLMVNACLELLGAPLIPFAALLCGAAIAVVATKGAARLA